MENKTMQERKEKGLCVRCGMGDDRTKSGKCLCEYCNIINTKKQREKRSNWKKGKMCARCGVPAEKGKKHCKRCLEYFRKAERECEKCNSRKSKEI